MSDIQLKEKEVETVRFFRNNMLKRPKAEDLLTLEDSDEHKLPALDKLLKKMLESRGLTHKRIRAIADCLMSDEANDLLDLIPED